MRIAFGGFHVECSTYNPLLTQTDDFTIFRGDALLEAPSFKFLKDYDATFLPTLHARSVPGAPISRETYEGLKREFLERLAAFGPIDGLYLALHGASNVEGMDDAEGDFVTAARAQVGPDMPITASYDLHGNLSQRIIDSLDFYSTYRTAPHIDVEATMRRSVTMLLRHLNTGEKPSLLWCPIPVVLPGERTSTVDEPAKSLYARLPGLDALPGMWDASLMVGYVWADEPRVTAAVVMTGTDRAVMTKAAEELALAYWGERENFVFGSKTGTIAECVSWAIESRSHPVVLADSGDNPTAGGVSDRADVLAELLAQKASNVVLAGITDRPAADAAYAAGVGADLDITIGATLDPSGSTPVSVTAEVQFLLPTEDTTRREAVLRVGGVSLVVTSRRRPFHDIADFTKLGLDPLRAHIVVVKSGYLSPELAPIANPSLMALSPGVVDQYVERLPRARTPRPTYPFDKGFDYQPKVIWSARSR
ncbi:MAG TPA: M81 family metallopeptidase [Devosiaceae bacterium]|jgi:microcystin degradation protein MlrC